MNWRKKRTSVLMCSPVLLGVAGALGCHAPAQHVTGPSAVGTSAVTPRPTLDPRLEAAFQRWERAGPTGDERHRERLTKLSSVVRRQLGQTGRADLLFVCTHNSRRSHMAQLLGLAAARRNGLSGVRTFSGGTEATAFNPRAVGALQRVGFQITGGSAEPNPRYVVRLGAATDPVQAYSKRFTDAENPSAGFIAVMTCSQADAACPFVEGAVARLAVPYEDPKAADGTPEEAARYDERVEQIGRDLAWVFAAASAK